MSHNRHTQRGRATASHAPVTHTKKHTHEQRNTHTHTHTHSLSLSLSLSLYVCVCVCVCVCGVLPSTPRQSLTFLDQPSLAEHKVRMVLIKRRHRCGRMSLKRGKRRVCACAVCCVLCATTPCCACAMRGEGSGKTRKKAVDALLPLQKQPELTNQLRSQCNGGGAEVEVEEVCVWKEREREREKKQRTLRKNNTTNLEMGALRVNMTKKRRRKIKKYKKKKHRSGTSQFFRATVPCMKLCSLPVAPVHDQISFFQCCGDGVACACGGGCSRSGG